MLAAWTSAGLYSGVGSRDEEDWVERSDEAEEEEDMVAQEGFWSANVKEMQRRTVQRDEEGKIVHKPVYSLSEVLSLSKQNYPHFQKMTYGVFMAATKLKHYFEEHPMKVVSEEPISEIMGNKDASGRIAKWAIQLSPYVPVYERRYAIKSQALADFLVDWAEMQYKPPEQKIEYWKMHFDGSKLKEGLGAGVVLTSPKGDHLWYVLQVHFRASNNVAEYEALVHGLKVAKEIGVHRIICYGDSDLVVQQCSGDWDAKDANMASYRFHVQNIAGFFEGCEFHHVPRAENEAADAFSKLGSSRQEIPPGIALAHLRTPSIKPSPESESIFVPESHIVPMDIDDGNPGTVPANPGTSGLKPEEAMLVDSMEIDVPVFTVQEAPTWVEPIKEFLINGTLPVDETESRRIQRRSKAYTIINGEVYKISVPVSSKGVWNRKKEKKCSWRFTKGSADTMPHPAGMGSTGPRHWKMQRIWFGNAMGARAKRGIIHTFLTRYRSGGTPCDPHRRATRRLCGPSLEGPGPAPSHSRLYRVGRSLPAGGFRRQHIRHARWDTSSTTTISPSTSEMAKDTIPSSSKWREETPVTYGDLSELKKKYDEIKSALEADLIGSFHGPAPMASDGRGSHLKARLMEWTCPPRPKNAPAPEAPNSSAFVVYKIGGDPSDYQFLQDAPKEIPHGYACAYVPGPWAPSNQVAIAGTSGQREERRRQTREANVAS
ncbi:hypothetical protein QYE76_034610 [Lolium multiflorum]|uniref:RNase H type-1 domain-containing protein n=1 Tax=Lolium multiflorum TaxID=4521 RepID=A0AAD8VKD7_LOLMU|nr:hypothetical protein QYE76_034610 [Lolium multiflorum]